MRCGQKNHLDNDYENLYVCGVFVFAEPIFGLMSWFTFVVEWWFAVMHMLAPSDHSKQRRASKALKRSISFFC